MVIKLVPSSLLAAFQYASLFFIVGVGVDSEDENELGVLEFIHCLVETLDKVRLQPFRLPYESGWPCELRLPRSVLRRILKDFICQVGDMFLRLHAVPPA